MDSRFSSPSIIPAGSPLSSQGKPRPFRKKRHTSKTRHMQIIRKYFTGSLLVTVAGLTLAALVGWFYSGALAGTLQATLITAILALLEISISFDNAVVNATVLKEMNALWQHRFLTWGMAIAVFGMRLVFPLLIVGMAADLSPWQALRLAALEPDRYAAIMTGVHHQVAAFGGAFLLLVTLKYFFNAEKEQHWIRHIEAPLARLGRLESAEVGVTLALLMAVSNFLPDHHSLSFLLAGMAGTITFLLVEGIGMALAASEERMASAHRAGMGMFLYLEVLDASFSFDGVIGAFALTNNLFIIAIGLGIGAMFVRSLTILMVERGTLDTFRYLEHGAFYAVGALAVVMLLGVFLHIPEMVTGLIGAAFIGLSIRSSVQYRRQQPLPAAAE